MGVGSVSESFAYLWNLSPPTGFPSALMLWYVFGRIVACSYVVVCSIVIAVFDLLGDLLFPEGRPRETWVWREGRFKREKQGKGRKEKQQSGCNI